MVEVALEMTSVTYHRCLSEGKVLKMMDLTSALYGEDLPVAEETLEMAMQIVFHYSLVAMDEGSVDHPRYFLDVILVVLGISILSHYLPVLY